MRGLSGLGDMSWSQSGNQTLCTVVTWLQHIRMAHCGTPYRPSIGMFDLHMYKWHWGAHTTPLSSSAARQVLFPSVRGSPTRPNVPSQLTGSGQSHRIEEFAQVYHRSHAVIKRPMWNSNWWCYNNVFYTLSTSLRSWWHLKHKKRY